MVKQFSAVFGICCVVVTLIAVPVHSQVSPMSQQGMPTKDKKKAFKPDPATAAFLPLQLHDKARDAARDRSKIPGVMRGEKQEPNLVCEIQVEGVKKIEPDAVLFQIQMRTDQPLSKAGIADDIRHLYDMGLFSDVTVTRSPGPNTCIVLSYKVQEKPTIYRIVYKNNEAVSEDDIKEAIDLEPFQIADATRIRDTVAKIRQLYVDKGFYLADVHYKLVPRKASDVEKSIAEASPDSDDEGLKLVSGKKGSPDFVDVEVTVDENDKVSVEELIFLGNSAVSSEDIKQSIRTREVHPLGFLTQWGIFNQSYLDVDLMIIEQLYQDRGHLEVQVGKPRLTLTPDKKRVGVHIPIREGRVFYVGDMDVSGDFVVQQKSEAQNEEDEHKPEFLKSDLIHMISLKKGDVFNRSQIAKDLIAITEKYRDEGYAYTNLVPQTQMHDAEQVVDVHIVVDAGQLVYIEQINIEGNTKTVDEVIRREMRVYEGELFSSTMLRVSEQRINQLGYFKTVKVTTRQGKTPDSMIVDILVEETSTGSIQGSFGYGTGGEGLILQAQVSQNNLFGRGQSLTTAVQWSRFRKVFDIQFVDPYLVYLGQEPLTFAFSAYHLNRYMNNFSRISTGGDLTVGYPIGRPLSFISQRWFKEVDPAWLAYVPDFENLSLLFTYTAERVEIEDDDLGVKLSWLETNQPRYTTSLRGMLRLDQRNNRLFPSAGYYLQLQSEIAAPYFGSSLLAAGENLVSKSLQGTGIRAGRRDFENIEAAPNYFLRNGINFRFYFNLDRWVSYEGLVFKVNADMGFLNTFNKELLFENYFLGGLGSLRGYFYRSIGPVERVSSSKADRPAKSVVIGGNKQIVFNFELEFPIVKQLGLNGVLFFDMGNVFGSKENWFYLDNSRENPVYAGTGFNPRDLPLKMYTSIGFGIRWFTAMAPIRLEWGFPLNPRPAGTPGREYGDAPVLFEFSIGPGF